MNTRSSFDQSLEELDQQMVELGSMTIATLENTKEALLNLDTEVSKKIIKEDALIDAQELSIVDAVMNIIIKEQPVAKDLRFLMVSFKISSELERICDHCAQIARLACKLVKHNATTDFPEEIDINFSMAIDMVQRIVKSYINGDIEQAKSVHAEDDVLDKNYKKMVKWVKGKAEKNPDDIDRYIDYMFITKYLERIGDRSNAIAEQIIYMETGELYSPQED